MSKVIAYVVAQGNDAIELVREVHGGINQGYQPLGGIAVGNYDAETGHLLLLQAMVKYDESTC